MPHDLTPDDWRVIHLLTTKLALLPGFVRAETLVVLSTACDYTNVHAATFPPVR